VGGLSAGIRLAPGAARVLEEAARPGWQARLALGFERRRERTVLVRCEHCGPLRVQKALYPEGPAVCQAIILHPPGGIAGGDGLDIALLAGAGAHAQLTTPGAGKWYRSGGRRASQSLHLRVDAQAIVEWLPQETIVFDGAEAAMQTRIELAAGALYCGWEILCLGRTASGERFAHGRLDLSTRIEQGGRPLWIEPGGLRGGCAPASGRAPGCWSRAAWRRRASRRRSGCSASGSDCGRWRCCGPPCRRASGVPDSAERKPWN